MIPVYLEKSLVPFDLIHSYKLRNENCYRLTVVKEILT